MKTTDIDWARGAVRAMLVRVVRVCAAELVVHGLAARWESRQALAAARACRGWK